jgi:hypothetical protein
METKIIRENRFCHLCSRRELGDEYHYIFECTEFINDRKLYFDFVHINRHNIIKYNNLMSNYDGVLFLEFPLSLTVTGIDR